MVLVNVSSSVDTLSSVGTATYPPSWLIAVGGLIGVFIIWQILSHSKPIEPTGEVSPKPIPANPPLVIPQLPPTVTPPKSEPVAEQPKFIGYHPTNVFAQSLPQSYPLVFMPDPDCVIKFPRKGRTGRKGVKEPALLEALQQYFAPTLQIFDDRRLLIKAGQSPYEPDITLIDERDGLNLFIDIEIDEPYEGSNDVANRRPTHYEGVDDLRNLAFCRRGWTVIRFAEIQVHQQLPSCCRFVADVIMSLNPRFKVLESLSAAPLLESIPQWSKSQALEWSAQRYREQYLGKAFGFVAETTATEVIQETEADVVAEDLVKEEPLPAKEEKQQLPPLLPLPQPASSARSQALYAVAENKFLAFRYQGQSHITRPISIEGDSLNAFSYLHNQAQRFDISQLQGVRVKNNFYTARLKTSDTNLLQVKALIHQAMVYRKFVWMRYTKSAYGHDLADLESLRSERTICSIQRPSEQADQQKTVSYNLTDDDHLIAFCFKRLKDTTFKYSRINELAILDLA